MLLALSEDVQIAIVGNITTILLAIIALFVKDRADKSRAVSQTVHLVQQDEKLEKAATAATNVKDALEETTLRQDRKLETVVKGVEEVKHNTNAMKDELMKATRDGALLEGANDERTRADAQRHSPGGS